jgi:hypothetical protein
MGSVGDGQKAGQRTARDEPEPAGRTRGGLVPLVSGSIPLGANQARDAMLAC